MYFALPFLLLACLLLPLDAEAAFPRLKDLLSSSEPEAGSNHTIDFTLAQSIPAGGKIRIEFEAGRFNIPSEFSFRDADLLVAADGENYIQRQLGGSATAVQDGVSVISGLFGRIEFTLNTTSGIPAGSAVRILFGNHATFGDEGQHRIINPTVPGSYEIFIDTRNSSNQVIETGNTLAIIIMPVSVGPIKIIDLEPPERFNGLPEGTIPANHPSVELSLNTNKLALCRFSDVPDTLYDSMTNRMSTNFTFSHSGTATGLENGRTYSFYVRCTNPHGFKNEDDFEITFTIKPTPPEGAEPGDEGAPDVPPSGIPGLVGGGSGPSGGLPFPPDTGSANFSGLAYPGSTVTILKDGKVEKEQMANSTGAFSFSVTELPSGSYTFVLYARDVFGRRSFNHSVTFSIRPNTVTDITDIHLSPTIFIAKNSISPEESLEISGYGIPGRGLEFWIQRKGSSQQEQKKELNITADANGAWRASLPAAGLAIDSYFIKVRSMVSEGKESDFSPPMEFGIGVEVKDTGLSADLNLDGRVNLVDFSILLFHWGTSGGTSFPPADINGDGTVNIVDFSIMLFQWTG